MSKSRNTAQDQAPRNEGWMRGRLVQSNKNLTVPSGKAYKRPKAGARGRDW